MNAYKMEDLSGVRCDYPHCGLKIYRLEAYTLVIETEKGKETYQGHEGCMKTLNEEKQLEYQQQKGE